MHSFLNYSHNLDLLIFGIFVFSGLRLSHITFFSLRFESFLQRRASKMVPSDGDYSFLLSFFLGNSRSSGTLIFIWRIITLHNLLMLKYLDIVKGVPLTCLNFCRGCSWKNVSFLTKQFQMQSLR